MQYPKLDDRSPKESLTSHLLPLDLLLPLRPNNYMLLLLAVDTQPQQIGPTVMSDAIDETFVGEDGVEVQIGVDDAFFRLFHVFGELAAVGPEHGTAPASGGAEQRVPGCTEEIDGFLRLHARRVQDESLGFDGEHLRERSAS